MKELSKYIENAMKGKSPLADLRGQIGKPGGHMCELEERMHGIDTEWENYFTSGCDEYEELRARRKGLQPDTETCNAVSPSGLGSWKM